MKPSIPQGTRDFSPQEVRRRQYIIQTLREVFECYGFEPIETPAMENLATLTGKYGEEGDRLIFKILNNGLYEKKEADKQKIRDEWDLLLSKPFSSPLVTERALRYDLTIPFARYVVMHQHEITFPFRRYQIQPVWRADRPQKGRYREFWQCDCDIVGTRSLICEAELLAIYQTAFGKLGIPQVRIKVNNRKILSGIAEAAGTPELLMPMTIALDKLDKIGWEGVAGEMQANGIHADAVDMIRSITGQSGSNEHILDALEEAFAESLTGKEGVRELREVFSRHRQLSGANLQEGMPVVEMDCCLARGLNYYTGFITEVVTDAVQTGSIGGGGRYDDLTGLFGLKDMSGVGISFGMDRVYDVLETLDLFEKNTGTATRALFLNFGGEETVYALECLYYLRKNGIAAEIYPDPVKFDRQMKYANKRNVPYVLLAGTEERRTGMLSIKDFRTGEQKLLPREDVLKLLAER